MCFLKERTFLRDILSFIEMFNLWKLDLQTPREIRTVNWKECEKLFHYYILIAKQLDSRKHMIHKNINIFWFWVITGKKFNIVEPVSPSLKKVFGFYCLHDAYSSETSIVITQ